MTDSTIEFEQVLRCLQATPETPIRDLVRQARVYPNKFAPTLMSAWRLSGRSLGEAASSELALHSKRIESYSETLADLERISRIRCLKGPAVWGRYPAGLVRQTSDLDCVTDEEEDLWRAAVHLVDRGWHVEGIALKNWKGKTRFLVVLERESPEPVSIDSERIELSGLAAWGDLFGVAPITPDGLSEGSDLVVSLLMVVVEGTGRDFGARDVLDAALLLRGMNDFERGCLLDQITRHGVVPEWSRLGARVSETELVSERDIPRLRSGSRTTARAQRLARGLRASSRPQVGAVGYLQRQLVSGRRSRVTEWSQGVLLRRVGTAAVLRQGLPVFGVAVDESRTDGPRTIVEPFGQHLLMARTPIGRFVFAPGDLILESVDTERHPDPAGERA